MKPLLLLLALVAIVLGILIYWGVHIGDDDSGSGSISTDFPVDVEVRKLPGVKKAISKVARTSVHDAKIVMLIDEDEQNSVTRFIVMFREGARYRAAEAVFREAGGGEEGWEAVEEFLPGSDMDPRFHAWVMAGLIKSELHSNITVWDIIDWEEKGL